MQVGLRPASKSGGLSMDADGNLVVRGSDGSVYFTDPNGICF
jgi:hypothetical protein